MYTLGKSSYFVTVPLVQFSYPANISKLQIQYRSEFKIMSNIYDGAFL